MHNPYEKEAKEKWGHTESYAISQRRVQSYTDEDWKCIKAEASEIYHQFLSLQYEDYNHPQMYEVVQSWQDHISQYYYPCSLEQLEQLGAMYIVDQRFIDNLDKVGTGLAQVMSEAIEAYCLYKLMMTNDTGNGSV